MYILIYIYIYIDVCRCINISALFSWTHVHLTTTMAGKHLSSPHHSPNPYIIRCNPSIHMISYHVSSVFVWLWHFATAPLDTSGCSSAVSLLPHCSFLSSSFCGLNNQLLDGHSIHTSGRISMMMFVLFLIGSCHWSNIILNEYSFLPGEIK